jgi:Homeodomain-like domain-containing protein
MFVHGSATRTEALDLIRLGLNDCAVSRRLGIPRSTIRKWRRPRHVPKTTAMTCPRCWRGVRRPFAFTDADYAELLALYLGDGHIVRTGRSDRFRLFLDSRYQRVIVDARELLERCFPGRPVGTIYAHGGTMTVLSLYCTHLACVFPQHGPGKKHERPIVLEPWQRHVVEHEPWPFLRGCIRSDGCVFVNRTGPYSYLSYDFKNRSADILGLFTDACDLVDVEYRRYADHVRIYRRGSVALMLDHVGIKD